MKQILLLLLLILFFASGSILAESNDSRASNSNATEKIKQSARDLFHFLNDFGEYAPPQNNTSTDDPSITQQPGSDPIGTSPTYGPPPAPVYTSELAQYMDRITQKVQSNCTTYGKGVVTKLNSYCLDPVDTVIGGTKGKTSVSTMKQSANAYYYLQCVGCALAMATANDRPYWGWGNAKQHAGQYVPGYTYVKYEGPGTAYQIKPGSLFVLTGGTYGHIGMVTEILKDDNGRPDSFRALECNYKSSGYFGHEKVWMFQEIAGFQVPNN